MPTAKRTNMARVIKIHLIDAEERLLETLDEGEGTEGVAACAFIGGMSGSKNPT